MPTRSTRRPALALSMMCLTAVAPLACAQKPVPENKPAHQARAKAALAPLADLPLRHLTLYSSGVGYFEHAGHVPAGSEATFHFTVEQLNDVLKSLLVRGAAGSVAVRYPGQEPIEQRLAGFGIDIAHANSLAQLLQQLRGVELILTVAGDPAPLTGRLIGVTQRKRIVNDETFIEDIVTLATDAGLRRLALDQIDNLQINDAALQAELDKALGLLGSTRQRDAKPVTLTFDAASEQVAVSYLLEMPLWKLSYRLDLSQDEPLLQAWAIVDNTTDTDWNNIDVTLVSGRPVSFIQNLYAPEYLKRPTIQQERFAGLRPQDYDQGTAVGQLMEMADGEEGDESGLGSSGRRRMAQSKAVASSPNSEAPIPYDDLAVYPADWPQLTGRGMTSNIAPSASAGGMGDLFAYHIDQPVVVPRGGSAMLPIVNAPVTADALSIYNPGVQAKHPMRGVRLTNTTDLKLDAGPVTVLDAGAYAGDAQLGFIAPGDDRLLTYGLDLEVTVDPTSKNTTQLVTAKLARGVLILTHSTRFTQTYEARNAADEDRQLLIEHPRNPGRELVEPKSKAGNKKGNQKKVDADENAGTSGGVEKTDALYRFPLTVPAGETKTLEVVETQPHSQTIQLARHNADQLAGFATNGQFPKEVRNALSKAVAMQRELEQVQRDINQINNANQSITREQERLRNNMGRLDRNSALYKRYVTKLDAQETQLENSHQRLEDLQQQLTAQQKALADYLESLGD